MEDEDIILSEENRSKLDDIVKRMEASKESQEDIQFVVNDFKQKYGTTEPVTSKKKVQSAPTNLESPSILGPTTSSLDSLSQSDPGVVTEQELFDISDNGKSPEPPKKEELSFMEKHFGWILDYGSYATTGIDPAVARANRRLITGIDPATDNISPLEETAISLEMGIKQLTSGLFTLPNLLDKTKDRAIEPLVDKAADWLTDGTAEEKEAFKQVIQRNIADSDPIAALARESKDVVRQSQDLLAYTQGQQQVYEDGIIESFKKGKIADGFQQISNAIVTAAPNTALILSTGGTGLAISGGTAAGSRLAELEREAEEGRLDVDSDNILLNAYAYGSLDLASNLVLRGLGKANKELFKSLGRETVEENVKQSFKNVLLSTGSEGAEEMLTQLGQNAADILLLDSDKDLMENVLDAGVIGLANAGVISSPAITAYGTSTLMSKRERAKIEKADNAIRGILKSMSNTSDAETIEILGNLLNENKKTIFDTFRKGNETLNNLPYNLKEEVTKNLAEMATIKMAIDNPANVESLDQLQQSFNELKQDTLLRINNQANQSRLNSLPDRGLKLKEQAAKELMQEFIDKGETEFNISDEQINNRAIELLTQQKQEQDAKLQKEDVDEEGKQDDVRSEEVETIKDEEIDDAQKEEVSSQGDQQPKSLEELPDRGLALKEEAREQLLNEAKEGGLENVSIPEPEVTKRANKLFEERQQEPQTIEEIKPITEQPTKVNEQENVYERFKLKEDTEEEVNNVKSTLDKFIPKGVPVISKLDKVIFEDNIAKPLEETVARAVSDGLRSRNKIKRGIAQAATNWFNGLPRTKEELVQKRQLTGKQNLAFVEGEKLTKELQTFVNADKESLRRVHAVLDPELYTDEDISNISLQDLSDNEKALIENLRGINEQTHQLNYDLGFIDKETYDKFKGKYIGREYDVFVEEALDISDEYFPQSKIFEKIFKQRKEIDQWKLDHKIEDPVYLTVSRMMQTQRNVAVLEYSQFLSEQEGLTRDYATQEEARANGYTILDGKAYGELNGKAVPNYIAEDFKGYFFANEMMDKLYDITKIYDKSASRQFLKRYFTVYSPVVQLGNLLSNQAFAYVSGLNALELNREVVNATNSLKNKDEDYKKLVLNNIIGANILKQDLAPISKQLEVFQTKEEVKGIRNKVAKGFKKFDDKARDLYSSSDDLMKLAAFKALKKQGLSDADAIERVFEGFQNYATVGKIWDLSSKVPVFGNAYIKFQADLQRIVKNAVTRRPLTTATFLGALKLMALMASEASEESEEARNIRESRPFIPKINLGAFDIPLVMKVGDKEVNVARFISPYYNYEIPNETWLEKLSAMTPLQLEQFETKTGQQAIGFKAPDVLLGSFYSAFISNREFRGKTVTDPYASKYKESGLSDEEKFFNRVEYVTRSVVPLASTLQDLYKAQVYGEDFYGRDKSVLDIITSKLIKVQTFDDKSLKKQILSNIKTINFKSKSINTKIRNIQRKLGRDMMELEKRKKEGKITQEQYDNKFKKESDASRKRVNKQLELLVKEQEKLNKLVNDINSTPELKRVMERN